MERYVPIRMMGRATASQALKAKNAMNVNLGTGALGKILQLAATVSLFLRAAIWLNPNRETQDF